MDAVQKAFQQKEFYDAESGKTLPYNLFVPAGYDGGQSYPLVLFIHDLGNIGPDVTQTLTQGIGATVWATPAEQAKHSSFVVAPQYNKKMVNDEFEATEELEITKRLLDALCEEYSIDTGRLYTTGQSMGCMSSCELCVRYPGYFAAALLVAGQWAPERMAAVADGNFWIVVSEGDEKAYPGMNACTEAMERAGGRVARFCWNAGEAPARLAAQAAEAAKAEANIKYTHFKASSVVQGEEATPISNHIHTWRVAYTIEPLRDWLFAQRR